LFLGREILCFANFYVKDRTKANSVDKMIKDSDEKEVQGKGKKDNQV